MAFIVDATVAGAWLLPDKQKNAIAEQAMARMADEDARAPDLLRHEIRTILLSADAEVVRLSRHYRLSAHDAAYLALALVEQLPLATLDRRLAEAARMEGVGIFGPIDHEP